MKTKSTSFRLTRAGRHYLQKIAEKLGISETSVLEILIRERATKLKVEEFFDVEAYEESLKEENVGM